MSRPLRITEEAREQTVKQVIDAARQGGGPVPSRREVEERVARALRNNDRDQER